MLFEEVIRGGTSARWHSILYVGVAVALILLAYETLATQRFSGSGIEFTVGSGYARLVNETDAPIHLQVKSHEPFIVTSEDSTIRYEVNSKAQESQREYTRDVDIPLGEYTLRLALGSNVTFSLSREAQASVTVVPYSSRDTTMLLTVTGMSVLGALYFAFRSLTTKVDDQQP
ncbi:MAG: hypothetical protein IAE80_27175 [Anaerolinea sp.]|nr:hypothetical protein [Anaerolinea sp.]